MRSEPRERRNVGPTTVRVLSPLFRYSYTRDAYVLRVIGRRRGPVLRVSTTERMSSATTR
jgi:hypothetical protein